MTEFLVVALFSFLFHETGHVLTGMAYGWRLEGVVVRWRYGAIGVKMRQRDPADTWKVALGGIVASTALVIFFWAFLPRSWAVIGVALNLCFAVINLLPIKVADGGLIFRRQG